MKSNLLMKRVIMSLVGVIVSGISVGLFRQSNYGTDPFQVLVNGIDKQVTQLEFGTLYMVVNLVMLILIFLIAKHYIGISTFINIFLLGYVVDYSDAIFGDLIGADPSTPVRITFLLIGIIILCLASALYFTANLGVSTYDAVALIMTDKNFGKFKYLRIGTDIICVTVGFALGGVVGAGTVVTAFFMGPFIEFFKTYVAQPLLYGKKGQGEA